MTNGAQDDIKRATDLARKMVTDLGMSDSLGPRTFGDKQELVFLGREISEQKDYGDRVADAIDAEVNKIITESYETTQKILTENRGKLVHLAEKLMAEETLEGEALEAVFKDIGPEAAKTPAEPSVVESKPAKTQKPSIVPELLPKPAPAEGGAGS